MRQRRGRNPEIVVGQDCSGASQLEAEPCISLPHGDIDRLLLPIEEADYPIAVYQVSHSS